MKIAAVTALLLLAATALVAAQGRAPDGETVYRQHCAGCHEAALPRMPTREALRSVTPEHIETALASFTMRRQGAALAPAERRAVAEFLSGRPAGSYRSPLDTIARSAYCTESAAPRDPLAGGAWNGWGVDLQNTRYQPAGAAGLTAANVSRLRLKWAFGFPGVSASGSQVTVVGSRAFVGSRNGMVYALDTRSGCLVWAFEADASVRSTPVVHRAADGAVSLYFGDAYAHAYALDASTGTLRWRAKVDDHPDAMITGAVKFYGGRVFVPVASIEEGTAAIPSYECCTFRGSIVALEAATGRQLWKTFTIAEPARRTAKSPAGTQLWGPSGAAVWSSPALDPDRNRLYVTTGDSYSNPPAPASDAIMALAMDTGRILWTRQVLAGDAWNTACFEVEGPGRDKCPESAGPDYDFGSSPVLTTLADGRRLVLAGQKSGAMYGVNPDTGEVVWKTQAGEGGVLGGIEWGFATDGPSVYASLSSAFEKPAGQAGGLAALDAATGKIRWTAPPAANTCGDRAGCNSGQPAAVSAVPGVVFSGSLDGHLRAYEAETGTVIWDLDAAREFDTVNGVKARGGSFNGPGVTLVDGMLFVSSGYGSIGFMAGNVLLAFTVDGR
jgi:polyvinyl alcohol dehydrogenase (cytochrome)